MKTILLNDDALARAFPPQQRAHVYSYWSHMRALDAADGARACAALVAEMNAAYRAERSKRS